MSQQQRLSKIEELKAEVDDWKRKATALRAEVSQWQGASVNQELKIDRLECTLSALIATLNAQTRFEKFDTKKLAAEMDRIAKARIEELERLKRLPLNISEENAAWNKMALKVAAERNHEHADSRPDQAER